MGKYSDMAKAAKEAGALKALSPKYFEFKKAGTSIVGRFRGRAEVASSLSPGTYHQYLFDTDDGLIKVALGAATDKEAGVLMEENGFYQITFQGKVKISGGRSVNKFLIEEIGLEELNAQGEKANIPF